MALRRLPVIDSLVADVPLDGRAVAVENSLQIPLDTATEAAASAPSATGSAQAGAEPRGAAEISRIAAQAGPDGRAPQGAGDPSPLGVLSVHFEGGRCRIACPVCYLGEREGTSSHTLLDSEALLCESLRRLPYRELAVALSEPVEPVLPLLQRLIAVAGASGKPVAITTTLAVAASLAPAVLAGVARLNLSIDPWKERGPAPLPGATPLVEAAEVQSVLRRLPGDGGEPRLGGRRPERVLIVTLSTLRFAEQVRDHLLAELLALPEVDRIALNAVKPPPRWCDRAFWLKTLHAIGPLLREHLDRRLFLDCYVAARLLGIGGCPARPDLSPAPASASALASADLPQDPAGAITRPLAFRACVYQREADFIVHSADELVARLRAFTPPARCPFPIH